MKRLIAKERWLVYFRAFSDTYQLMDGSNRENEKAHILQTWVIVIKRRIVLFPVVDRDFDEIALAQSGAGDVVPLLKVIQYGDSLMLELCTELFRKLCRRTGPFSRANQIGDVLQLAVRGAEVGMGAKRYAIIRPHPPVQIRLAPL